MSFENIDENISDIFLTEIFRLVVMFWLNPQAQP